MSATPLARSPWKRARWLVLAPHPDDETIGAGALIAETAVSGRLGGVAFLTDGTGSHPDGARRLSAVRRREASLALHRLGGGRAPTPIWIGWRDAHPPSPGSARFEASCRRLAALLRRRRIDALAVTAADEPHCDHAAAYRLAARAVATSRRRIALFEYVVWGNPARGTLPQIVHSAPMSSGRRRHALRAHRSQLTPSMGPGFRLPPERIAMPRCDRLHLVRFPR